MLGDIEMKITIDPEFQSLIPPLSATEYRGLERSLYEEGCREPIVVWKHGRKHILLDGHTRLSIIFSNGKKIKYRTAVMKFANRREAYNWIISNQMSRRNVSREARDYLIGKRYLNEKKAHGRPKSGQNDQLKTAVRIANELGITEKTVRRAAEFSNAVDTIVGKFPEQKQREVKSVVLSSELDITKKDILELSEFPNRLIKDVITGKKKFWQARAEANKIRRNRELQRAGDIKFGTDIKLYVGDCLHLSKKYLKPNSISLICTDPEYNKSSLPQIEKLGQIAQRVLKPSGFCCFYMGKMFMDKVVEIMSRYLEWYWMIALLHGGSNGNIFNPQTAEATGANEFYKPILVFQKPPKKKPLRYFDDVIKGSGSEKHLHPFQQSEDELSHIIEIFSDIGTTVLDPFCGASTTGIVCKALKRKYIGFDSDPECIKQSRLRLKDIR
jgi:hypothetical protein